MIGEIEMNELTQKLAALDLAEEQAALDDLKRQAAELAAASQRGHARMLQIAREIEALKAGRGDGEAAAEALLEGDSVLLAAPQRQALEDERHAIKSGLSTLAQREIELSRTRREVLNMVEEKSADAVEGFAIELERRAKTVANELAQIYADADCVGHGAGNSRAALLAASIRDGLAGLRAVDKLVPSEMSVSPDLVQALQANPARPLLGGTCRRWCASFKFGRRCFS